MLFIFDRPDRYTFWTKNTPLSLDMLWLNGQGIITHIDRDVPAGTHSHWASRTSPNLAHFVIELLAGTCDTFGIKTGHLTTVTASVLALTMPPSIDVHSRP